MRKRLLALLAASCLAGGCVTTKKNPPEPLPRFLDYRGIEKEREAKPAVQ